MRAAIMLCVVGCGASNPEPAPLPSTTTPIAPAPDAAIAVATTPDAAPPSVQFENLVVAGELDAAKVSELLAPLAKELGTCLAASGPTTTELSLEIIKSGIGIRNAWQNDAAVVAPCLRGIFPELTEHRAWNVNGTMVYVVVKAGTNAPDAPALAERRAEFVRLYCDLETLAGAEKLPAPDKQNRMVAWARDHIKHPAPLQVASDVPTWNPAERTHKLEKAIRAEGIKKCPMQRW